MFSNRDISSGLSMVWRIVICVAAIGAFSDERKNGMGTVVPDSASM